MPDQPLVGIPEHTGETCEDVHIRAQAVAGFILHLSPDAYHAAARQRRHRANLDAVVLGDDAGDRLALFGEVPECVSQCLAQGGDGGGKGREREQHGEHSRQHGAADGPMQPVSAARPDVLQNFRAACGR